MTTPPPPTSPRASPAPTHPLLTKNYHIGSKLGRGCFATVYRAIRRRDAHSVAIKVVEKDRLDKETAYLLQTELQILQVVSQHPGIVTLLDSLETDTHMYFILDFVDGGPLLDRIVKRGTFSENDARIMIRTILITLQFLSKLGCVHRDIKPENILVDKNSASWPVKLTDFGLSAKMQQDQPLYGALGTPLFLAPEILKGHGYDCSCDMWSLGVVLYIVLCGYPPFPFYNSHAELITSILNCDYSFPAPEWDHVSADAKQMLSQMLETDPKKRITPTQALAHPWITLAQSTTTLPNSKLKLFNARRKFKAVLVAVRTAVDFMNIVQPSQQNEATGDTQKKLVEDVERNRKLIQKLSVQEPIATPSASTDTSSNQLKFDQLRFKSCRRSLILPVSMFATMNFGQSEQTESVGNTDKRSTYSVSYYGDSPVTDSQVMHSKAKAMVAEVRDTATPEDTSHLFSDRGGEQEQDTNQGSTTPKKLKQLDFSDLGIS